MRIPLLPALVAAIGVALIASAARASDAILFVPARNFKPGRTSAIARLVLHCTEGGTARSVSAMFALGGEPKRSAHYVVDASETVQCVRDGDTAFAAPPVNVDGLHVEICGWARWSEEEWRASGVLPRVVELVRRLCRAHAIPVEHVDAAGLKSGACGVTTHADVSAAFGQSTHTDPGSGFPLLWVLQEAKR